MSSHDLVSIARRAPLSPGVYLMKNAAGKVIYVGKAKALRRRLQSYLSHLKHHSFKTRKLIESIHSIDTILVKDEVEALLLERSLIRSHHPRFNILLRDDKNYPYLKADLKQPWPRITVVRRREDDGATYLGPFSCQKSLWSIIELVHRIFPLVRCSPYEFEHTKRPCNYYGMKLCWAPCHRKVDREAYHDLVREALEVVSGKHDKLKQKLTQLMLDASAAEDYPLAATYRNQLQALAQIAQQKNSSYRSITSGDIIGWHSYDDLISIHILCVRDHILSDSQGFLLENPLQEDNEQLCSQFLLQYYAQRTMPQKILLPFELTHIEVLTAALRSVTAKLKLRLPHFKEEKELSITAHKNALLALENNQKANDSTENFLQKAAQQLPVPLKLERIECFDISHLQGTGTAASLVCFQNGRPHKASYRKYNIATKDAAAAHPPLQATSSKQSIVQGDDYGALRSVMRRRLKSLQRDSSYCPDLILIDGGKGQLNSLVKLRNQEFPQISIPFVAIAKAKSKGSKSERLFFEQQLHPFALKEGTASYRLFTQLRDEAHRFALAHHRSRRKRERHSSPLERIPGIGPELRKRLLQHFPSLDHLKRASTQDLTEVSGISTAKAQQIHHALRQPPN